MIRARIRAVTVSTTLCSILTLVVLSRQYDGGLAAAVRAMGIWPVGLAESFRCLVLVALLFAGPLYEYLIVDGLWEDLVSLRPVKSLWRELTMWRNIVVVGFASPALSESSLVCQLSSNTRLCQRQLRAACLY